MKTNCRSSALLRKGGDYLNEFLFSFDAKTAKKNIREEID